MTRIVLEPLYIAAPFANEHDAEQAPNRHLMRPACYCFFRNIMLAMGIELANAIRGR